MNNWEKKRLEISAKYAAGAADEGDYAEAADAEIAHLREALKEVEEYFDQRADAEYFTDSAAPFPNEEMKLLGIVREALAGKP